jgi:hypothetical protein
LRLSVIDSSSERPGVSGPGMIAQKETHSGPKANGEETPADQKNDHCR